LQVNVVEYALDVIDDNQDQPEGLQKLLESQKKYEGIKEIEMLNSGTNVSTSAEIYKPAFANSFISESIVLGQCNLLNIVGHSSQPPQAYHGASPDFPQKTYQGG
jgi:hypothetical protein